MGYGGDVPPSRKPTSEAVASLRPACLGIAQALLDEQRGASSPTEAAERVCVVLHLRLEPWIGADACTRLLRRALNRAAAGRPALAAASIEPAPPHLVGWASVLTDMPPDDAREFLLAFLALAFDQLGRVVGDAVAARLLLPDAVDAWQPPPTSHDDGGDPS